MTKQCNSFNSAPSRSLRSKQLKVKHGQMMRVLILILAVMGLSVPAHADPADVDAAARGVVRVVLIGTEDGEVFPVSHGSGFAVTPRIFVTNAHVIREALQDDSLRIGIVPSEGEDGAYGKPLAVSPRNDLALIEITEGDLRLPPLTFAGGVSRDMGEVSAVGYPMNVDVAQGLDLNDIFRSQPPVKSRGFLSGERPSLQFDTLLHTAPIARGNSGGPLLDGCGRVLGVNSFGADSDGSDAEFYFAVSLRELLPFLRENNLEPSTSALPCRSIEELNAAERARFDQEREQARERIAARNAELSERRNAARLEAQITVMEDRENAMALAMMGLLLTIGAGYVAAQLRKDPATQQRALVAGGVAGAALIGTIMVWVTRPGFEEIEERVAAAMDGTLTDNDTTETPSLASEGTFLCTLVPERSRVMGARTDDVEFDWAADGCVNGRTQYGFSSGEWSRVFVPDDEAAVSVNFYDPQTREFRTDRYLLRQSVMDQARAARGEYSPPACGVTEAAQRTADQQSSVLALMPDRPNERLVYTCEPRPGGSIGGDD